MAGRRGFHGDTPLPSWVAAVSAPSNLALLCGCWMNSFGGDPNWVTPVTPILFGAKQTYDGISDLMTQAVRPEYLEIATMIVNQQFPGPR